MKNREEFINKFIDRYYQKSLRKRRSSNNEAFYIANTINNVCRNLFDRKVKFQNEEIYKAFKVNDFSLMESNEKDFTWERFHNNSVLASYGLFINIEVQKNRDLKSIVKRSYPDNWNPETVERISELKNDLNKFWAENKHLMEQ